MVNTQSSQSLGVQSEYSQKMQDIETHFLHHQQKQKVNGLIKSQIEQIDKFIEYLSAQSNTVQTQDTISKKKTMRPPQLMIRPNMSMKTGGADQTSVVDEEEYEATKIKNSQLRDLEKKHG